MLPGRLSALPPSSFAMLANLLDPVPPGAPPIALSIGDPRGQVVRGEPAHDGSVAVAEERDGRRARQGVQEAPPTAH